MSASNWWRLVVEVVSAGALVAASLPARAAAPPEFDRRIEVLVEQGQFSQAAAELREALVELPETFDNRGRRNYLATQAINAYKMAFDAAPRACETAAAGVALADQYLQSLVSVYGATAVNSDEYVGVAEAQRDLEAAGRRQGCSEPPPLEEAVASEPESEPAPAVNSTPVDVRRSPVTRPQARARQPLITGVAVSGALTGVFLAISLGTGLSRLREPIQGAAYNKIFQAAKASYKDADPDNNVDYGADSDMCAAVQSEGVENRKVQDACDAWDRLGTAAIVTGVMAGALGATTLALAGVLIRRTRGAAGVRAQIRRRSVVLGVGPGWRGGVHMTLGFRF